MRKLIIIIALILLTGCENKLRKERTNDFSRFVIVESTESWDVLYDNNTKVMYTVSKGPYNRGNFTILVNSDGKPLLWKDIK